MGDFMVTMESLSCKILPSTDENRIQGEFVMKNWMKRFALLAVLGSIMGGTVLVGCGGGDEAEETNTANNAASAKDATDDDA
jgi:hypothetical protein